MAGTTDFRSRQLASIASKAATFSQNILNEVEKLKKIHGKVPGNQGRISVPLMNLKDSELFAYVTRLTTLLCHMLMEKKTINGNNLIPQIIKHRIVLEKIRNFEINYLNSIDAFFGNGEGLARDSNVRRSTLVMNDYYEKATDEQDEESNDEELSIERKNTKKQRYIIQENMDIPETTNIRKPTIGRTIIKELQSEFLDDPEIYNHDFETVKKRRRFEEDNFTRLRKSKRKNTGNKLMNSPLIDSILSDLSVAKKGRISRKVIYKNTAR